MMRLVTKQKIIIFINRYLTTSYTQPTLLATMTIGKDVVII